MKQKNEMNNLLQSCFKLNWNILNFDENKNDIEIENDFYNVYLNFLLKIKKFCLTFLFFFS